jgi:uncharacterized protein
MKSGITRRMLTILVGVLILAMAVAPASYAGEDGDQPATTSGGSGGSDSGSGSGGVQTGAGGMASAMPGSDMTLPLLLAGTGLIVLTAAGGLSIRRREASDGARF